MPAHNISNMNSTNVTNKFDEFIAYEKNSVSSHIRELLKNLSDITYPHTTPTPQHISKSNRVAPLFIIFGAVIVFFICCVMAKSRKGKEENGHRDDAYNNWYLENQDTEIGKLYNDRMIDHRATCHDHKSHHYHHPHFHGGHYDHGNQGGFNHGSSHQHEVHVENFDHGTNQDAGGCD